MADSRRLLTFDEVHALLLARCIPEPNSGCLLWEGCVPAPKAGKHQLYGSIRLHGKMVATHRVAWQAVHGPIPPGVQILHRCDVGLCCNPAHLFAGDNESNIADKMLKDRGRKKLTHQKAKEIRKMVADGMSQGKVAAAFGIDQSSVSRIVRGESRITSVGI